MMGKAGMGVIPFLLLCLMCLLCCNIYGTHGALRETDSEMVSALCNGTVVFCNFMDERIWVNESVPQDDDDVVIAVAAEESAPLTIVLNTSISLNSLTIESDYFTLMIQSVPSFSAKTVKLVGSAYSPSFTTFDSTLNIRTFINNYANSLLNASELTVDSIVCSNSSLMALTGSNITCGTCDFDDINSDGESRFIAQDVVLNSPNSFFTGYADIANLVVVAKAYFVYAVVYNVTFMPAAYMFAHNDIEIDYITFGMSSTLVLTNTTTACNIATRNDSFIVGKGDFSVQFQGNPTFSFGNPLVAIDMSPYHVKFQDSNIGTITNVAFGSVLQVPVNPGTVVNLTLNDVTFTLTTLLTANITANSLTVENGLTIIGDVVCQGGTTSIYGQLYSSTFSQVGGDLELSGYLTADTISISGASATIMNSVRMQGDVITNSSVIYFNQPLMVQGDFTAGPSTVIQLPGLTTNSGAYLNVSGNINMTAASFVFSISNAPSERTVYPLFAYGGSLIGSFLPNFTVPADAFADRFSVQQRPNLVVLVYTPSEPSFFSPGPKLYATIGAIVLITLAFVTSIYCIRRNASQKRKYEIIPS